MALAFSDIRTHVVEIEMSLEYYYVNKIIDEKSYTDLMAKIRDFRNTIFCLESD